MSIFDSLVERRILEAQAAGQLSNLRGEGAPLELDDDRLVPEELRVAYRVLKNAGFVPPEVEALRELHDLETRVAREEKASEKRQLIAKMRLLMLKTPLGRRGRTLHLDDPYYRKIAEKLARGSAARASDADHTGPTESS